MVLSLQHNEVCFTPLKKYCLSIALCYAWRGWMKEPDNLTVIGRKKKEGKAPHFKMEGGRKMDELRKMHLGREMSSFKMSDHALPFILLTDFLRPTLPKLRWQMKQPIHALPAGGARKRIQKGKRLGRCTFVSLTVASKGWSLTFSTGGVHQPLMTSSCAVGATGRCECAVKGVLQPPLHLCVGRALPWLHPAGRAEETTWMWQSGHHFCKVLRHLSELKHLTMCKEWTHYWRAPESWICLSKSVSSWVKVGEQPSFFFMFT